LTKITGIDIIHVTIGT